MAAEALLAAAILGLASGAAAVPAMLAFDEAGNYEAGTFTNGANRGFGFGAWQLSNQPADLGDSTAGGGGDVDSTNVASFRFMGNGTNGWCNGRRDFVAALRTGAVARFVFAYNWNGGGRGVDLYCATGQFVNLIHIADGDIFQVSGETVSSVWAPQAIVAVEIAQETNGIQVTVVRTANGAEDLNYSTNILRAEPVTGLGFYCGGYACAEADNPKYALYANDLRIEGDRPGATSAAMIATNQFRLEWPAATELTYRVETAEALNDPIVWSNATPGGLVFSNAGGFCELPVGGPQRFYRFVGGNSASTGIYMVVDLSVGPEATNYPITYLDDVPDGGWTDEYKTTKLVLRRISAGTFIMGSVTNELGRDLNESQHAVTLTKDFYIGVFETTQKQWERVMGNWPGWFSNVDYRDSRPVESVSYNDIRGTVAGTNWPADGNVDTNSFMGRLRTKTGQAFDLPTEAQWEYACRAGTTSALNSGFDLTNTVADAHMDAVGRYWYNGGSGYMIEEDTSVGSAKVGSYQANAWGLCDMHGNEWEWCLDWFGTYTGAVSDPPGSTSGSYRVVRGGGWGDYARGCRSAYHFFATPGGWNFDIGFRPSRILP